MDLGHLPPRCRRDVVALPVEQRAIAFRLDRTQGDRVDSNPIGSVINGGRAGESFDGGLGGGVRQRTADGPWRLVAGDVHDGATDACTPKSPYGRRTADDNRREVAGDEVKNVEIGRAS